ncbi:hypothetical protein IKS38_06315 [bacterium]|nr:hypothetical protein [bacterium]
MPEDVKTEEVEVFRHSRRRSRYHACKSERKEKMRKEDLERFAKKDPRPRQKRFRAEEEEW